MTDRAPDAPSTTDAATAPGTPPTTGAPSTAAVRPGTLTRLLVLLGAVVVLAAVAVASVLHAAERADRRDRARPGGPRITAGHVALDGRGLLVFRNMAWGPHRDELTAVPAGRPGAERTAARVKCLRFYADSGTGICLQAVHGPVQDTYRAVVLDAHLKERARYDVPGIPSRARVSPSGRYVAWTAFVGGDSYAGTNFSTRAAIADTRTGSLIPSLEAFRIVMDGRPYHASDVNFWGVTFAADDRHFYATLATHGSTRLVRGDLRTRTVTALRSNVECPSLSPDGTRIAFKKRVEGLPADAPWRLYVLDLRTGRETPLAETRSVDDQAVWRDDRTLTYALPGDYGADLYTVPADGTGAPRRLTTAAVSPAYLP
ncbi:TolB family protein [Streptomyces sp. NPDC002004]